TAHGAQQATVFGIAGLGDLVLTCTGKQSRNHELGVMIGEGGKADDILAAVPWVAEGAYTAPAALAMANNSGVELPITSVVVDVLSGKIPPDEGVEKLMTRPLKAEFE
ncbi:glycerol-3-phosphate dehydrogenase, partial [bacterium]